LGLPELQEPGVILTPLDEERVWAGMVNVSVEEALSCVEVMS
jgi:hypothetical protein